MLVSINYLEDIVKKSSTSFNKLSLESIVKHIYTELMKLDVYREDKDIFYRMADIITTKLAEKYKSYLELQFNAIEEINKLKGEIPQNEKNMKNYQNRRKQQSVILIYNQIKAIIYRYTIMKLVKFMVHGGRELDDDFMPLPFKFGGNYPELVLRMIRKKIMEVEEKFEEISKKKSNQFKKMNNNWNRNRQNNNAASKKKEKTILNKAKNKLFWGGKNNRK